MDEKICCIDKNGQITTYRPRPKGAMEITTMIEEFNNRDDLPDLDTTTKIEELRLNIVIDTIEDKNKKLGFYSTVLKDEEWKKKWLNSSYYNTLKAYCGGELVASLCLARKEGVQGIVLVWTIIEIRATPTELDELITRMNRVGVLQPITIREPNLFDGD